METSLYLFRSSTIQYHIRSWRVNSNRIQAYLWHFFGQRISIVPALTTMGFWSLRSSISRVLTYSSITMIHTNPFYNLVVVLLTHTLGSMTRLAIIVCIFIWSGGGRLVDWSFIFMWWSKMRSKRKHWRKHRQSERSRGASSLRR